MQKNKVFVKHKNMENWGIGVVVRHVDENYYVSEFENCSRPVRTSSSVLEPVGSPVNEEIKEGDMLQHIFHEGLAIVTKVHGYEKDDKCRTVQKIELHWLTVQKGREVHYDSWFKVVKNA